VGEDGWRGRGGDERKGQGDVSGEWDRGGGGCEGEGFVGGRERSEGYLYAPFGFLREGGGE